MTTLLVAAGGLLGVLARSGALGSPSTTRVSCGRASTSPVRSCSLLAAEPWLTGDLREAIGVGFLGGLTTLSTFSVQVVLEVEAGRLVMAAAYLAASVLGGMFAAAAGFALGRVL